MPTRNPDSGIKRVLLVIARLNKGGTAQYLAQLTSGLQRAGYEVIIATGYVQGEEIEDESVASLPIHRIPSLGRAISPIRDLRARRELQQLVTRLTPDLIYTHTFKAGLIGRTLRNRPILIHAFHGHLLSEPELQGWRRHLVVAIERWLAPRAIKLVTVGEKVARELLEVGVGKREQYLSIPPGVAPLALDDSAKVLTEFELTDSKRPIVAWLARVTSVKAPNRVVELAERFPNATFIQAGGGDLLEELQGLVGPANWKLLGWQPATKIWAIADIAISTSENEGMPVALIEAQLAGIPVIGIDVGSVGEVIASGETGFVVANWGGEFEERLRELIESPELRNRFGRAAKARAEREFKPESLIERHIALFDSVDANR